VLLEQDADGSIGQAAIAVGACSAVPVRLTELERRLAGAKPDAISHLVEECVSSALAPIDDVRGSAGYRKHAAAVLVTRALHKILNSRVREAA
jgi:CO/xanthine dehydrogenase FAD-binding subunit